jgi:ankyrin repeat protein
LHGNLNCINALLAGHANVNAADNDGGTPLMAAAFGHAACIRALIASGANINARDKGSGRIT